jgi:demethylmenaquinone methyltransferase/2-methoxy-6-polyprenyl-1,4-benzoquinol methylase
MEKQSNKMAHLTGAERARYVQGMFSRIARRYDLMNRLMTAGQDVRWRREVIRKANIPARGCVLDLGAGTGDLAREIRRQHPGSYPVAADFTLEMMRVGKNRSDSPALDWSAADALRLPFLAETFEAVVSGFLLRNVIDVPKALDEQYRVLRPGGRVVVLDTTRPTKNAFSPFINFHLHVLIPFLGRMIAGAGEAYTYLPESTEAFLPAEQLAAYLSQAGFKEVGFHRLLFGTVAIHWGRK